jgi:hypothetical protein
MRTPVPVPKPVAPPVIEVARTAPPAASIVAQPVSVPKQLPRVRPAQQQRITRRFYSLAYASPELLANSRIMRVRVPRAALLSFGLPLSAYQAQGEKVGADVIYTEDGIARAIRFVNEE